MCTTRHVVYRDFVLLGGQWADLLEPETSLLP